MRPASAILAAVMLIAGASAPAFAASRTWSGAGANNLWTTAQNWQGNVAPVAGDQLTFPAGALQTTNVNNFANGTAFAGLRFLDTYSVTGNRIVLDNILWHDGAAGDTVSIACNLTLAGDGELSINVAQGGTLTLTGVLSGTQGFRKGDAGLLRLGGTLANTFTALTRVFAGTLALNKTNDITAIPAGLSIGDNVGGPNADIVLLESAFQIVGAITILPSGLLDMDVYSEDADSVTMSGGRIDTGTGVLDLDGNVEVTSLAGAHSLITGLLWLGGVTRTFTIGASTVAGPTLDIQAGIGNGNGIGGLVKAGGGILALSGSNTYTGVTAVDAGTLLVRHTQGLGFPGGGHTVVSSAGLLSLDNNVSSEAVLLQKPNGLNPGLQCEGAGARTWSGPITVTGPNLVHALPSCLLRLGPVAGTGELWTSGNVVELTGAGTYGGDTRVQSGMLRLSGPNRIPDASVVHLSPTGILNLNGFNQTLRVIMGLSTSQVQLGAGTLTIASPANSESMYPGAIVGTGSVVHAGPGAWRLTGPLTYTGPTTVAQGTLRVDGSLAPASQVTVTGGTLAGIGTVGGTIVGSGGRLEPGAGGVGTLTTGSLSLTSAHTLAIDIGGSDHSRVAAAGTVNLGGAALALSQITGAWPINPILLIDNDGSDPIAGTFANLPEGATVEHGGQVFRISYVGGSGNDAILQSAAVTYFLAEGSTGAFFDTEIALANPHPIDVLVTIDFLVEGGGAVITQQHPLPPLSRTTILVEAISGLESTAFSARVRSENGQPIVVERTMWWGATRYGAHTEKASAGAAPTWYFAEGSQGFFSTFLLLVNPVAQDNVATVRFLLEGGGVVTRQYTLPPLSRQTVHAGDLPELVNASFGMEVTFGQGGVAERAMYFGLDPLWNAGHESAGVTAPSATWFLAEGATGPFFETFVLLANPNAAAADVTVRFLPASGVPVVRTHTVPANGRLTINIEGEDPSLANVPVATDVSSSLPIVVERAQYWPDPAPQWYEAHNSFGVTEAGTKWGLAEGRVGEGMAAQTYILLANPGATPANVTITFLRQFGAASVVKQFTVNPTSRLNVSVGPGTDVPELADEWFGALIESSAPIVVERAMYTNAGGQVWGAGTNATATKLP